MAARIAGVSEDTLYRNAERYGGWKVNPELPKSQWRFEPERVAAGPGHGRFPLHFPLWTEPAGTCRRRAVASQGTCGMSSRTASSTLTSMASSTQEKVRENRLRRMATRQGLQLVKSRRRDPRALDYGTYWLVDASSVEVASGDADAIEAWLTGEAE